MIKLQAIVVYDADKDSKTKKKQYADRVKILEGHIGAGMAMANKHFETSKLEVVKTPKEMYNIVDRTITQAERALSQRLL